MSLQRISLSEFRDNVEDLGDAEVLVSKACPVTEVKKVGKDVERMLQFILSEASVDRDKDTLNPKGWDLKEFKKSGVVLWAHDARLPPVAAPKETWVDGGKALKGIAAFTPPDMNHPLGMGFGYTIYRMYREGYLHAVSVGFQPIKWKVAEERATEGDWAKPINFLKQALLEYSPVPVPANPNALLEASSKGIDLRPILNWAEMELDEDTGLVVPRSYAEGVRNELKELCGKGASATVPESVQGDEEGSDAPSEPGVAPEEKDAAQAAEGEPDAGEPNHQVDTEPRAPETKGESEDDGEKRVAELEDQVEAQGQLIEQLLAGLKALGELDITASQRRTLRAAMRPFFKADSEEPEELGPEDEIEVEGVEDVESYVAERLAEMAAGAAADSN